MNVLPPILGWHINAYMPGIRLEDEPRDHTIAAKAGRGVIITALTAAAHPYRVYTWQGGVLDHEDGKRQGITVAELVENDDNREISDDALAAARDRLRAGWERGSLQLDALCGELDITRHSLPMYTGSLVVPQPDAARIPALQEYLPQATLL